MGSSVASTVTPCCSALARHMSSGCAPSARTTQATSAKVATAIVFTLPMTVTHALSDGALPIAMLKRSQQKMPVTSRDRSSPSTTTLNSSFLINSSTVIIFILSCYLALAALTGLSTGFCRFHPLQRVPAFYGGSLLRAAARNLPRQKRRLPLSHHPP